MYSRRQGSSVSSRILNPFPSHRTGSKRGLCCGFIGSIHETKRLKRDVDHLFLRLEKGGFAKSELTAETFVGDGHDRSRALAADLRDREESGRHHVDRGDSLALEIADQLGRLLKQGVGG